MKCFFCWSLLLFGIDVRAQLHIDTIRNDYITDIRTFSWRGEWLQTRCYFTLDDSLGDLIYVRQADTLSGKIQVCEFMKGFLTHRYVEASDTADSPEAWYYTDGSWEEGASRKVPVYLTDTFFIDSVYTEPVQSSGTRQLMNFKAATRVGTWHYHYPDGNDSAVGTFAYEAYMSLALEKVADPSSPMVLADTVLLTDGVKDGEWRYYSRDGKLLYTEEWSKDVLIRKTGNESLEDPR